MKQRIITSVIALSLLATVSAWGQTQTISRKPTITTKSSRSAKKAAPLAQKWIWKGDYNDGMACVKDDKGKYGFINYSDKLVIPCKWNRAGSFCQGLAAVVDNNDKVGYIDKTGHLVIPCKWKVGYNFGNNAATVKGDDDKYYSIDKTGTIICKFSINSFKYIETDLTATESRTEKRDQNGEQAALIKIKTTLNGFSFDGGALGIVGTLQQNDGELWLYVPTRSTRLTIKHPSLGIFSEFYYPVKIKGGRTYEMILTDVSR